MILERLKKTLANKNLRWRIMFSVGAAFAFMTLTIMVTMQLDNISMQQLGQSYSSNTELTFFTKKLAKTQKALEDYVNYHTFESIDNYYNSKNQIEIFYEQMQDNPSVNELSQKEYVVHQFARSFSYYSNNAISARRANNAKETEKYYKIAMDCYKQLQSQILELNNLRLQENAQSYQKNHNKINVSRNLSLVFFIIFTLLVFALLYISITSIMDPLVDISNVAHKLAKRDFDVPLFNNNSNDEIGNICQAFDRMIISIREYIDTIWEKAHTEAELKEKEMEMQTLYTDAQLRALQNQINPHFLFNTLNTGAQLAMMENADKTCYFIEQTAEFFRYNIQRKNKTASISDELGLIDNFVYIMKVRFGNRLEFTKDIPDMSFDQQIPLMTLQPIVENCMKHGLKNPVGKILLKITTDDKFINISVSDNAEGMSADTKEALFKAVEEGITRLPAELVNKTSNAPGTQEGEKRNGTGLISVFLRLKLHFHRNDLYDITAGDDGIGTKFIIRIPKNV